MADTNAYEQLISDLTTTSPDQMVVGEAPRILEPTDHEDQTEVEDHASLMPPQETSLVVDKFCYAPLLIFGARATYLSYFVSSMTAYHLCVLPARLSALPDSFWT